MKSWRRRYPLGGRWYILMAAVLWGTTGTAQSFAPDAASPMAIGSARLAVGGLALLFIARKRGRLPQWSRWPLLAITIAATSMAAYQLLFFTGVARTGVAVGTIAAIGSAPVFAGGITMLLYGENPGRRWLLATLLATAGCGLLVTAGRNIQVDLSGILLALGAGLTYATSSLASKRVLIHLPPDAAMAIIFGLGALLLLPILLLVELSWLTQLRGWAVILHLGLVATALAYLLYSHGLKTTPVATAVTLSLTEPLTAGMMGILWLGEQLSLASAVGIGLLLAGLAILTRRGTTHVAEED